uniref:Uncharacterized protein n=1 Tax=Megaviridae environmental sample TaxID=1737588 RepID=A0A5J6VJB6_9VIRU|nr:MAG: hypothetical protein [Megaviridae environmental sample]
MKYNVHEFLQRIINNKTPILYQQLRKAISERSSCECNKIFSKHIDICKAQNAANNATDESCYKQAFKSTIQEIIPIYYYADYIQDDVCKYGKFNGNTCTQAQYGTLALPLVLLIIIGFVIPSTSSIVGCLFIIGCFILGMYMLYKA